MYDLLKIHAKLACTKNIIKLRNRIFLSNPIRNIPFHKTAQISKTNLSFDRLRSSHTFLMRVWILRPCIVAFQCFFIFLLFFFGFVRFYKKVLRINKNEKKLKNCTVLPAPPKTKRQSSTFRKKRRRTKNKTARP